MDPREFPTKGNLDRSQELSYIGKTGLRSDG